MSNGRSLQRLQQRRNVSRNSLIPLPRSAFAFAFSDLLRATDVSHHSHPIRFATGCAQDGTKRECGVGLSERYGGLFPFTNARMER